MTSRLLGVALLLGTLPAIGQSQTKKPLTQADWDRWRSITAPTLSPDGKWAAYTLTPQVGDGEFVVRSTSAVTEIRVPVGYIGRPNNTPGGLRPPNAPAVPTPAGGRGQFSPDSRYAVVTVAATKAVVDSVARAQALARGSRGSAANTAPVPGAATAPTGSPTPAATNPATKVSFVLIKLADGTQSTIDGRNPRFPKDNGKWMLYSLGADSSATDAAGGGRGGRGGGGRGGAVPAGGRRQYGSEVVLRNMDSGAEEHLADVSSSIFDDSARVLAYTVTSHDSTKDGVFIRNLATGATQTVLTGQGNYRGFAFDHAQQQFTFASDKDDFGKDRARSTICVGAVRPGQPAPVITPSMWPKDMRVPETGGSPTSTKAGNAIVFQLGPPPEDTIPADSLVGKSVFDLWNSKDPQLQPTHTLRA